MPTASSVSQRHFNEGWASIKRIEIVDAQEESMTACSVFRLCSAIVGAMGAALILNPRFSVQELFGGGLSNDNISTNTRMA